MASTATNKQPLLVDRPFHFGAIVNGSSGSTSPDLGAAGVTGILLLDCTNNDGGLVEDAYAISRGTEHEINLYLSNYADLLPELCRYLWATIRRDTVTEITTGPIVGVQGGYY